MSEIRIEYMPLSGLRGADLNPKMHAGQVLDESIERFGYVQPMTIDEATGQLVAGHGRLEALLRRRAAGKLPPGRVTVRADGEWLVPVVRGVSFAGEMEAMAYLLADNRISEAGGWSYVKLVEVMDEVLGDAQATVAQGDQVVSAALSGTGFSAADMKDVRAKAEIIRLSSTTAPDEATSAQVPVLEDPMSGKPVRSRLGEIYQLGPHRVMCGDCRSPEHWDLLLGDDDQRAQVVVTSPPYAQQRDYDESSGFKPIPQEEYISWWSALNDLLVRYLEPDGSFFLNIKEHCEEYQRVTYVMKLVLEHVERWGWYWIDTFAWTHGGTPRRVDNRFKNAWEPIYQFVRAPTKFKFRPEYVRRRVAAPVPESLWQGGHPNDEDKQGDPEAMEQHIREAAKRRARRSGMIASRLAGLSNADVQGAPGQWDGSLSNAGLQGVPGGGAKIRQDVLRSRVKAGNRASIPNPRLDTQQGMPRAGELLVARIEESMEGGFAYPSNVLSLGRNREALGHTAAFPVSLPDFFIRAYSEDGDLIVDPFLGSGSTLIAAEMRGRICYGFEISPRYCDMIRDRYEAYKQKNKQESLALRPPELDGEEIDSEELEGEESPPEET